MAMAVRLALTRAALQAAQRLSPEAAGWLAERIFCTPFASSVPDRVRTTMARARRSWTEVDGARVAVWRWGRGPAIALAHGWGSRAARLAVYVDPLVQRGFSVVAFDAPAHGASGGTMGSGIQAARVLRAVAAATPLYGAVAHSLGAAPVLLALDQGLDLRRAVFVAPQSGLTEYACLTRFARTRGGPAAVPRP